MLKSEMENEAKECLHHSCTIVVPIFHSKVENMIYCISRIFLPYKFVDLVARYLTSKSIKSSLYVSRIAPEGLRVSLSLFNGLC